MGRSQQQGGRCAGSRGDIQILLPEGLALWEGAPAGGPGLGEVGRAAPGRLSFRRAVHLLRWDPPFPALADTYSG